MNAQASLQQVLHLFDDGQIIELIDVDMFHFRKSKPVNVGDDEFIVCDFYENWHLKSLSKNQFLLKKYFKNNGKYYNGGHVPIIGKVKTFKKILNDWINIHKDFLIREDVAAYKEKDNSFWLDILWWAGMFSFNAACERNCIKMTSRNFCFIPGANSLVGDHYIGHFSVDPHVNKHAFPKLNLDIFPDNDFHNRAKNWFINRIDKVPHPKERSKKAISLGITWE
jgi:hypothetical protein